MNIYEKLSNIQQELKAPKNQYNSFGGYAYRSCEDILEAVKPLLKILFISSSAIPIPLSLILSTIYFSHSSAENSIYEFSAAYLIELLIICSKT